MREAQARLDEAQADRSRVLAAFAVTVGSTGAVAGLFGLNEREVRVARRTVGKDDARAVAEELLSTAVRPSPKEPDEPSPAPDHSTDHSAPAYSAPAHAAPPYSAPAYTAPAQPAGNRQTAPAAGAAPDQNWSPAMDAVLIGSWQTGVDLRELATEFGLDLSRLMARAQQLSAQGRFYPGPAEPHAGRHRRGPGETHETEYTIPAQQTASWNSAPAAHHMTSAAWHTGGMPPTDPIADVSSLTSDWDSALSPWGPLAPAAHEEPAPTHQPWAQYHLSS
ncbi:hypothetical protein [Streptomyces sp. NPDC093097]|uniref:hypothetical protein n=1 Tax=Streptomyces sp. NPDC093097 TaxID=3366027 RepID=UPI0038046474